MAKYKVPVRVSVAPVQTYIKIVTVEAGSRKEAAAKICDTISDRISEPGWKSVGGLLGAIRPDHTVYDTYLDELSLEQWTAAEEPSHV